MLMFFRSTLEENGLDVDNIPHRSFIIRIDVSAPMYEYTSVHMGTEEPPAEVIVIVDPMVETMLLTTSINDDLWYISHIIGDRHHTDYKQVRSVLEFMKLTPSDIFDRLGELNHPTKHWLVAEILDHNDTTPEIMDYIFTNNMYECVSVWMEKQPFKWKALEEYALRTDNLPIDVARPLQRYYFYCINPSKELIKKCESQTFFFDIEAKRGLFNGIVNYKNVPVIPILSQVLIVAGVLVSILRPLL